MTTLAPTIPWLKNAKEDYRVCGVTTLKVDMHTERLIIANAVMAVVTLTLGGIAALLIALTRWQAIHLLDAAWFYRLLTLTASTCSWPGSFSSKWPGCTSARLRC